MTTIPHTGKRVDTGKMRFTGQPAGIYFTADDSHQLAKCIDNALAGNADNALTRNALEVAAELLRGAGKPERPTLDLWG